MSEQLSELAVRVAVAAARFVCDERPDRMTVAQTKTTALDVVTEMDTGCERLIRAQLAKARPDDGVLGEEDGLQRGSSGLTWVVDPIDGTVNYLYDLPAYAVSVAVVEGDPTVAGAWEPVAGAVCNPRTDEVFEAVRGAGARVARMDGSRGRPLAVSSTSRLDRALVATGFSYELSAREHQGEQAAALLTQVRDLRRAGAASLDLCHVGAGRLDGYYERGLHPWDLAAGMLVVTEAGGLVTGFAGSDRPGRDGLVAAGPAVHGQLLRVLR